MRISSASNPSPFQPDLIDPANLGRIAVGNHEGRNVLHDLRATAEDGMPADAAELVHAGEPADHGMILDHYMAGEGAVVGKNDVVSDHAIVGDMGVGEEIAVTADHRFCCPGLVPRFTVQNSRKLCGRRSPR